MQHIAGVNDQILYIEQTTGTLIIEETNTLLLMLKSNPLTTVYRISLNTEYQVSAVFVAVTCALALHILCTHFCVTTAA